MSLVYVMKARSEVTHKKTTHKNHEWHKGKRGKTWNQTDRHGHKNRHRTELKSENAQKIRTLQYSSMRRENDFFFWIIQRAPCHHFSRSVISISLDFLAWQVICCEHVGDYIDFIHIINRLWCWHTKNSFKLKFAFAQTNTRTPFFECTYFMNFVMRANERMRVFFCVGFTILSAQFVPYLHLNYLQVETSQWYFIFKSLILFR